MPANFYHDEATMRGADMHTYWALGPEGVPIKAVTLYVVLAVHQPPVDKPEAIVASVTSCRHKVVQGRLKLKYVQHIPIPLGVPHPVMEPIEYGLILYYSSSTPFLRRASVTAGGHPLGVCLSGDSGLNVNCWEGIKLPSGYVHSENTVMTEPSLADAIDALTDMVVDVVLGTLLKLLEKVIPKKWKDAVSEWLKHQFQNIAQPFTRVLEKIVKDILKSLAKKPSEKKAKELTLGAIAPLGLPHV